MCQRPAKRRPCAVHHLSGLVFPSLFPFLFRFSSGPALPGSWLRVPWCEGGLCALSHHSPVSRGDLRAHLRAATSLQGANICLLALGALTIRWIATSPKVAESSRFWARHRGRCWALPVGSLHAQTSSSCSSSLPFSFF